MIIRTFVESVDLSGRTVFPFVTYAVSRLARPSTTTRGLCPRSAIGEGFAVRGEVQNGREDVEAWPRKIGPLSS
jgi:hypothetical protein